MPELIVQVHSYLIKVFECHLVRIKHVANNIIGVVRSYKTKPDKKPACSEIFIWRQRLDEVIDCIARECRIIDDVFCISVK